MRSRLIREKKINSFVVPIDMKKKSHKFSILVFGNSEKMIRWLIINAWKQQEKLNSYGVWNDTFFPT